ncbi:hypothetical protein [Pseudovibrio sp. POLY-S9]|uniref:hypothetical protein n=1 Tax=Pseudovibrio sp. POLY-S9 TaxID=1576596 RepID=UPI00070C1B0F|nr:hypothetical protein [Pseudovibrio sp. POLY-S9]
MTLSDTVMPVAKLLFEGEGKILSQDHLVTVESQVGALVIRFFSSKRRIVVTANLRQDLGDSHYWRDLKPHATPDENVELRRTFAPGRFTTQTQQVLSQINRDIVTPALPRAYKALAEVAEHERKKRKIAETINRAAPNEAEINMFGRYKLTKAIRKFDPQASGSIEVRADSEYCEVEIRSLSLHKMENLVAFLNED